MRIKIASQINYLSFLFGNSRENGESTTQRCSSCLSLAATRKQWVLVTTEYHCRINHSWIFGLAMPSLSPSRQGRVGPCPPWDGAGFAQLARERWLCSRAKCRHPLCDPTFCTHCSRTVPPASSLCAGERPRTKEAGGSALENEEYSFAGWVLVVCSFLVCLMHLFFLHSCARCIRY